MSVWMIGLAGIASVGCVMVLLNRSSGKSLLRYMVHQFLSCDGIPRRDQWPPISEDEFIRRCSPGVDRERALRVRRIIAEQLGVDYDRVYPEQRFIEDLGCD